MRQRLTVANTTIFILIIINICSDYLKHAWAQITCEPACQRGIDDAYEYAASIHKELTTANDQLLQRILKLENEDVGIVSEINSIRSRMKTLENVLRSNVSNLHKEIGNQISTLWDDSRALVNNLETDLRNRIDDLTRTINSHHHQGGHQGPSPGDVFANLTRRMDNLENGKVFNLSTDNQIWRRNFRVINSTFARIKNNNCICT